MKLVLERLQKDPDVTIGNLLVDGVFECWTLEDAVRPDGVKIYGETAIPPGLYSVDITRSPRFKVDMPLLVNVAGFVGVRIHTGNTADDTEGCVIVGTDRLAKSLGRSRMAYDELFRKLSAAKRRSEPISMEII